MKTYPHGGLTYSQEGVREMITMQNIKIHQRKSTGQKIKKGYNYQAGIRKAALE